MKLSRTQIDELIEATRGTCSSLEEICQRLFDHYPDELENEDEVLAAVDQDIFCCEECGWWSEMSEMAEDDTWRDRQCAGE